MPGNKSKIFLWFGIAIFFGTVVFVVYDYIVKESKTALILKQLKKEFISITPLPGAICSSFNESHKPRQPLVGRKYWTNKEYEDIRKYYDKEFKNQTLGDVAALLLYWY